MRASILRPRRTMLRWFAASAALLAVSACDLPATGGLGQRGTGRVTVALLVPQGAADPGVQQLATSLTNAAQLAVSEAADRGVTVNLRVYDTAGSAGQTAQVTSQALADGAQVIVGPLYSQNANAAGNVAAARRVPVMTFSNTPAVAGGNVFLLGNTFDNTAARLVSYARGRGLNRFMVVNGASTAEAAGRDAIVRAVQAQGGQVVNTTSFPMSQEGVTAAAPSIADNARTSGAQAVVLTSDPATALPYIARALPDAGLGPNDTQFLGMTRWDQPASAMALPGLQGGWFTLPDQQAANTFANKYAAAYGSAPANVITFLGYDGVAAAAQLAATGNFTPEALAAQAGFDGGNGTFRFMADGTNRRALAVATIQNNSARIIDAAPNRLGSAGF
ncbi:MAG: penicillin-binding protein activator [Qingshengfaniella sp.]